MGHPVCSLLFQELHFHPKWKEDGSTVYYDVAILQLNEPFDLEKEQHIMPICLPVHPQRYLPDYRLGNSVTTQGYGLGKLLRNCKNVKKIL